MEHGIASVRFGDNSIDAGKDHTIRFLYDNVKNLETAIKLDKNNNLVQQMILGTGCIITYKES